MPGISATATAIEYAMRLESPMTKFSNVSVDVGFSAHGLLSSVAAESLGSRRASAVRGASAEPDCAGATPPASIGRIASGRVAAAAPARAAAPVAGEPETAAPAGAKALCGAEDGIAADTQIVRIAAKYGKQAPAHIGNFVKEIKAALR